MPPRAVLFDFDGVIADTENVHIVAWERTFALMGWEPSPGVCERAAEEDDRLFLESVFVAKGVDDGDVGGWLARKQQLALGLIAEQPRIYPGVRDLVDALRGRSKLAVVTSSCRANVAAVLKSQGLEDAFDLIIAGEDVTRPKPHPEGYRKALLKLKIKPAEAVALEDSPSGIEAATAAGLRVLAVGHRRPKGDWAGESIYLSGLEDLDRVLESLG